MIKGNYVQERDSLVAHPEIRLETTKYEFSPAIFGIISWPILPREVGGVRWWGGVGRWVDGPVYMLPLFHDFFAHINILSFQPAAINSRGPVQSDLMQINSA